VFHDLDAHSFRLFVGRGSLYIFCQESQETGPVVSAGVVADKESGAARSRAAAERSSRWRA
jgi:hypothetical protein